MESLTFKGLHMQYSQRKQRNQQKNSSSTTGITEEGMYDNDSNSIEREKCNNEKTKDTKTTILREMVKNNNYKDIPNGNTITSDGNPLMVDYHHRKTSAEIVSEAKILLEGNTTAMITKNNGSIGGGDGAGGGNNSISISSSNSSNIISNNINNIGGARLISTRRPITPREPRRQLYGKLAPPGRPPSAFSLRYLQFESRALPSLEPIQSVRRASHSSSTSVSSFDEISFTNTRSESIGTLLDYESKVSRTPTPPDNTSHIFNGNQNNITTKNNNNVNENNENCNNNVLSQKQQTNIIQINNRNQNKNNHLHHSHHHHHHNIRLQGKFPVLLSPLQIITTSLDNSSEEIPSQYPTDLYRRKSESNTSTTVIKNYHNKTPLKEIHNKNSTENENQNENEKDSMMHSKKYNQHHHHHHSTTTMLMRQTKSFDTPLQSTSIELSKLYEEDNGDVNNDDDDNNDDHDNDDADGGGDDDKNTDRNKNKNKNRHENNMKIDQNVNIIQKNDTENVLTLKKRLARSNDLLAQSSTETLLDLLKAHSGIRECNEETVQHINAILVELYSRVKGAKGNWRGAILGGLYGLVECSSPKILLAVARVVFALGVTGSNLTGACKLVFKVARNEINDYLFIDTDIPELLIDGLGRASPIDEPEACIYGYGAVRFLANAVQYSNTNTTNHQSSSANVHVKNSSASCIYRQKSLAQRLVRHGAVQLMVLHLQILNEAGAVQKLSGSPLHALYQLSAALRALAGIPQIFTNFKSNSLYMEEINDCYPLIKETSDEQEIQLELACPHLVKAAEISTGEIEIQANIVRTLSILSENDACCECLSQFSARIGILLGPCDEIANRVPEKPLTLLNRVGYILGNIMTRFDEARTQLYENDVAMQYLLEALDLYSKQNFTIRNQMGDTVADVLIKLVRVIANMSVNADVGYGLGLRPRLGKTFLRLLITINNIKESKIDSDLEELRIATLGALHNLCFYHENSTDHSDSYELSKSDSMCSLLSEFSIALCDTLICGTEISKTEAARVLGNMTRNSIAREAFCSNGGLKAIVQCLNSEDYELISTSSGVLVNLLGDWERRAPFRELKGPRLLHGILQKATQQEDWLLAGIVCQALWNFLIDSGNVIGSLGENEADCIAGELAEYLDEDKLFKGHEPDILWEQFATVATDLLEKIQASISVGDCHNFYSSDDE